MNDRQFIARAEDLLHRMALERTGWRGVFRRWVFRHEPLRHDAANLLRSRGLNFIFQDGTQHVGETNHDR